MSVNRNDSVASMIAPANANPNESPNEPPAEQFGKLGVRQIELDVFHDPKGGHYAEPSSRKTLKSLGIDPGPEPDVEGTYTDAAEPVEAPEGEYTEGDYDEP